MPPKKKKIHFTSMKELNETTISTSVIAAIYDKSVRAIERNSDPNDKNYLGLQTIRRGQYRTGDTWKRLHKNDKNKVDELQGGSLRNSKERKEAALAETAEFDLAAKRKEIIKVDDVIGLFEKILSNYTSRTNATKKLSVPRLLIAKDDKAVTQILEIRDNGLINELTTTIENIIRGMAQSIDKDYSYAGPAKAARRRKAK